MEMHTMKQLCMDFKMFLLQNKLIFLKVFYLFERQTGAPIHWFSPQMPTMAKAGPGLTPGVTNSIQVSQWVTGIQPLKPSLLPLRVYLSRKLGIKPRYSLCNIGNLITKLDTHPNNLILMLFPMNFLKYLQIRVQYLIQYKHRALARDGGN